MIDSSRTAIILAVVLLSGLSGCGGESKADRTRLEAENRKLNAQVSAQQAQLDNLKTAPENKYAEAVRAREAGKLTAALTLFRSVYEEFPSHPIAARARKEGADLEKSVKAEAARREEERKYQPRSPSEAIEEWKAFRNNEGAFRGKTTTWRFKVSYVSGACECPIGSLDGLDYSVAVHGTDGWTYQAAAAVGQVPQVREGDWVVVTGRFKTISTSQTTSSSFTP